MKLSTKYERMILIRSPIQMVICLFFRTLVWYIINKPKRHLYDCSKTPKFVIVQHHISIPRCAIVIEEVTVGFKESTDCHHFQQLVSSAVSRVQRWKAHTVKARLAPD